MGETFITLEKNLIETQKSIKTEMRIFRHTICILIFSKKQGKLICW